MNINVEKQPGNSYKVTVTVGKEKIQQVFNDVRNIAKQDVKIDGFRKGKAPPNLADKKLDHKKIRSRALNSIVNDIYARVLKENRFDPITQPTFDIREFTEDKGLDMDLFIVEKPEIDIKDYKTILKKVEVIEQVNNEKEGQHSLEDKANENIVDALIKNTKLEIAPVLIETETNRMMNQLIEQTSKLGITLEDYLKSQDKTPQEIRKSYEKASKKSLQADFILTEIAKKENIDVTEDEINEMINKIPDEESRKLFESPQQKLYIKVVLLKSKVLEKLREYITIKETDTNKKEKNPKKSKNKQNNDKDKNDTKK